MNKIGVYLRLSQEDKNTSESESISNQRDYIRNYITSEKTLIDYEIEEYIDDGYSGTSEIRPAFQRLLEDIKSGQLQCIIVKDMSRFSRDYLTMGNFLDNVFPFLEVRFIAINDGYDSLKERKNGSEIDTQFKTLLYDYYSRDLSEKVRSATLALKAQGKIIMWAPAFGYLKDPEDKYKIILDKKTVPIVKEAFDLILKGYSCIEIANIFNNKGYITRSERKKELKLSNYDVKLKTGSEIKKSIWDGYSISTLISNEIYTGDYVYNKYKETSIGGRKRIALPKEEWKRIGNNHEAIVSKEIFNQAQKIKEKRKSPRGTKSKCQSIYSKKVFCKECGRSMTFKRDSRKKANKEYKYRAFYCKSCKERRKANNVHERDITAIVQPIFDDFIKNSIEKLDERKCLQEEKEINYQAREQSVNKKLQSLYEEYRKKQLSKEKYLKEKEELLLEKSEIGLLKKEKEKNKIRKELESLNLQESEKNILTKEWIDKKIEKIVVSRFGDIEVVMRGNE